MRTTASLALTATLAVTAPVLSPTASYAAPVKITVGDRTGDASPRADLVRQSVIARTENRLETRVEFADGRPFGAGQLFAGVTLFTEGDSYFEVDFARVKGEEPTFEITRNGRRAVLCDGRPTLDRDRGLLEATFPRSCINGKTVEIIAGTSDAYTADDHQLGFDSTRLSRRGEV